MRGKSSPQAQAQDSLRSSSRNVHSPNSNGDLPHLTKPSTCIALLRTYTHQKTLIPGHVVHDHIIRCGHHHVSLIASLILQFYLTCGASTDALRWFEHIPVRDVVSWNLIIGAFVQQGDFSEALQYYRRMQQDGVLADQVTFVHTLSACKTKEESLALYADIRVTAFDRDTIVGTALVSTFGRTHSLNDAHVVFDRITAHNIISWNALISAHIQNGQGWKVSVLFNQSQQEGLLPDKVTVLNMLTAHAEKRECRGECKRLHLLAINADLISDNVVGTALICAYGVCGYLNDVGMFFQEMQERGVVSWNAMIKLYAQEGQTSHAFAIFHQMQVEGITPDSVTFIALLDACVRQTDLGHGKRIHLMALHGASNLDVVLNTALLNLYGKCGKLQPARHLFIEMRNRNVVSWNTIISAYTQHGFGIEVLQLFYQMQHEAVTPNKLTLIEILSACASQAALTLGKRVHSCLLQSTVDIDEEVGSSLISLYGKCGNSKDAQIVFDKMHNHKRSTWNSLIATYAQLGDASIAVQIYENMRSEGVFADDITFVSILAACSRGGMLDEGCHYFVCMHSAYGLRHTAEHYDCMIDLLCRAGLFGHASFLIRNMLNEPTVISWTSLLCAYGVGLEG